MNECKIVEDLLPLYAEELVSRETAEFIGEHCDRCGHCRKLLERSKVVLPVEKVDTADYQKALKKYLGLEGKRFVVGIAMGYEDPEFAANEVRSEREDLENITKWFGFEAK